MTVEQRYRDRGWVSPIYMDSAILSKISRLTIRPEVQANPQNSEQCRKCAARWLVLQPPAQALGVSPIDRLATEPANRRRLRVSLTHVVRRALEDPWGLAIDATANLQSAHQKHSQLGYNAARSGRLCQVLHTF